MTFYRLLFWLAFQLALERHFFALGTEKPPKMEPKPSQNGARNASEIDLMLRTLKSDFEQTLPHFCSFLAFRALQKSSQNRLKNSIPLTSSKKWYQKRHFSDFRPSWLPNWLQHGSPKLAQNRPKSWQIVYKSVTAYKTLPKCPKTSKNLQKITKIFKEKIIKWINFCFGTTVGPRECSDPQLNLFVDESIFVAQRTDKFIDAQIKLLGRHSRGGNEALEQGCFGTRLSLASSESQPGNAFLQGALFSERLTVISPDCQGSRGFSLGIFMLLVKTNCVRVTIALRFVKT